MPLLITALLWFCILGCALLGGVYFAFSAFIMTALRDAGQAGIAAMNSINRVILRSAFMPFFLGTTLASAALAVIGLLNLGDAGSICLIAGGLLYLAGMFGVTMLCNVPLNDALLNVTTESRTGTAIWNDYLRRWTRWNHVRTVSCLGAAALFVVALTR
ncbi:MAG TPA: anthrone oxygenase family protein [Steroidobacteraceae bacterium]|nr:anthrone oxygenase family protein [Steroidobacteraceae bacterium]